jgi:hypothetical protein
MVDDELDDVRASDIAREQARIELGQFHRSRRRWNIAIAVAFVLFAAWAYYGYMNMPTAAPPAQTTGQSQPAPSPAPPATQ